MDLRVTAYGHSHLSAYLHAKRSLEAAGALPGVALSLVRLNLPELLPGIEYRDGEAVLSEAITRRIRFTLRRDQPEAVLSVYRQVQGQEPPPAFVLCVRGEQFGLGEPMSAVATERLEVAKGVVRELCAQPDVARWREWCTR